MKRLIFGLVKKRIFGDVIPFVMNFLPKIDPWDCSNLKRFCISSHENYMPRLGCEKRWKKWCKNGNKMENSLFLVAKRVKCEFDIAFIMPSEIIQWLQSRWHSPYILVYKHPLLTYLLVSVPSILTLRHSGSQVWEDFCWGEEGYQISMAPTFPVKHWLDEYVRNPRKQFSKIQWSFLVPIKGALK